jgi:protein-S-isoprenylcysteine O-methyltransferase Ste14
MPEEGEAMTKDAPDVVIHPPIALAAALVLAFALERFYPLPFVPVSVPRGALGFVLVACGLLLVAWSARTFRRAHTQVLTSQPATAVVSTGPYGFSRNPIYVGIFLGLVGLAVGFNTLWLIVAAILLFPLLRYGVIGREERYLEAKFGPAYLSYKSRVRRWL